MNANLENPRKGISEELKPHRKRVESQLRHVRSRVRQQLAIEAMTLVCGIIVLLVAVSLCADWLFRFELWIRLALLVTGLGALAIVGWRRIRPLLIRLELLDVAMIIDRRCAGIGQRAANVIQLPRLLETESDGSSRMIRAAVLEDADVLGKTHLVSFLDSRRRWRFAGLLLFCVALPVLFASLQPAVAGLWVQRWVLGSDIRWPQRTYLSVVGLSDQGRILVPKGERSILEVAGTAEFQRTDNGWRAVGRGSELVIQGQRKPLSIVPESVHLRYWSESESPKHDNFTRHGKNRFRFDLIPLHQPLQMVITGGDDWIGPVTIIPSDRPKIDRIEVRSQRPGKRKTEICNCDGDASQLLFLFDTKLELHVHSTMPLKEATLQSDTGPSPLLKRVDATHFMAAWTMQKSQVLEIQMVGQEGGLRSRPRFLTVGLQKDRQPRITARLSGVRQRISPQATLPLAIHASDDLGLASLELEREILISEKAVQNTRKKIDDNLKKAFADQVDQTEWTEETTSTITELNLPVGTLLKLRGRGTDNCIQGPQSGESRWLNFQVVSADELFYEILIRLRKTRAHFQKTIKMAKTQASDLDSVHSVQRTTELSRKHQAISRHVWLVANQSDAARQELMLNKLGTQESLKLLQDKIITPLRELHSGPLLSTSNLLKKMAQDQEAFDAERKEARQRQAETVQTMEQILAQMSQWESFVDVVNQLQGIIDMQNSVLNDSEKIRKERVKGVFDD